MSIPALYIPEAPSTSGTSTHFGKCLCSSNEVFSRDRHCRVGDA
jgi:hypothetical protein